MGHHITLLTNIMICNINDTHENTISNTIDKMIYNSNKIYINDAIKNKWQIQKYIVVTHWLLRPIFPAKKAVILSKFNITAPNFQKPINYP